MSEDKLKQRDLDSVLSILPLQVKSLLVFEGKDIILAGGFLRAVVNNEKPNDIDLFGKSKESVKKIYQKFKDGFYAPIQCIHTQNSYTVKGVEGYDVQFVYRWTYDSPEKHVQSFDFTISQASLWFDRETHMWDSYVCPLFYEDCLAKSLRFTNPVREEEPAGSLMRVLKFVKKDYEISPSSLAGVINKLVEGSKHYFVVDTGVCPSSSDTHDLEKRITYCLQRVGGGGS